MANLTIEIEGTDVTGTVLQGSVSIRKSLSNRSTMKFAVRQDVQHYEPGEVVYAYWDGVAIFGGKIESVDEELVGHGGTSDLVTEIEVADWSRLLDRFVVSYAYEAGTPIEDIFNSIIKSECPELYYEEGVTLGTIADFTPTERIVFSYEKVSDCVRDICKLFGLAWSMSPTMVLSVLDRETYASPWTIGYGAGATLAYRKFRRNKTVDQYRNIQWLIAGKGKTEPRSEYFRGDSSSTDPEKRRRTFNTAYPVSEIVYIKKNTDDPLYPTGGRVGVKGVDEDGNLTLPDWKQWFYQVGSSEITQNSAEDEDDNPTLTASDILEVRYVGQYPIVRYEEDAVEVASRASIEGGSGKYFEVEEDDKVDSAELAEAKATRYLDQYGRIPDVVDFEVDAPGLEPGHLMDILIPSHAINAEFMVEEVRIAFPTPSLDLMRCRIRALDGEQIDGWAEFWRKAAQAGRKFGIRENEVVTKAIRPADAFEIGETFTVNSAGGITIPDELHDPFSYALLGVMTTAVGGEEIPLCRFGRSQIGGP